jgi:predicted DNA-binding protein
MLQMAKATKKSRAKNLQKTSVYLERKQTRRLAALARKQGRPQSQIIREAIDSYEPAATADRDFALAGNFKRIDSDPRPISRIADEELMRGFGE